jgi:2,3-bisphosphoglycerate-dependent phosphoglycerate mutase
MRLCLVRHGETPWNAEARIQGWTDVPLNPIGVAQAQAAARELAGVAFDAIHASPLQRAHRTAEAIAGGRPIHLDERLRERHFGELQGLTRGEIAAQHPEVHRLLNERRPGFQPPGGETVERFAARVRAALLDLRGERVLVVAHGGVLDIAYRLATDGDLHAPRRFALPNAAINWLRGGKDRWHVEAWGLTDHLDDSKDDHG